MGTPRDYEYKSVGFALASSDGGVIRPETYKNWFDKGPTAGPAKIYKTEKIAARYGEPVEVFIKVSHEKV